jgi:hypothetical protein
MAIACPGLKRHVGANLYGLGSAAGKTIFKLLKRKKNFYIVGLHTGNKS